MNIGENPDEGFKPTSGGIERVQFQSTPNVWGYFSVGANGGVHEFADSQFGHIFASGRNRNEARKALVLALKGMVVRGEIRTAVEYLVQLLETDEFKDNTIDTSWLDGLIAKKEIANKQDAHMIVFGAALFRAFNMAKAEEAAFTEFWQKGQVSVQGVDKLIRFPVELTYQDIKYSFEVTRNGPDTFTVETPEGQKIEAKIRERPDGALVAMFGGEQHEIEGLEEPLGLRMILDGQTWLLPNVFDPSELRTDVTGKLIRFLQEDGAEVVAGKPFAEVEAMKMVMPLIAAESGKVSHAKAGGAVIEAGDLLATLELKDPSKVKKISTFSGQLRVPEADDAAATPEEALDAAVTRVNMFLDGYSLNGEECISELFNALTTLPADQGRWERAADVLEQVITRYLSVESLFEGRNLDAVMQELIRANSGDLTPVLNQVRAHMRSKERQEFIVSLLKQAPTLPQRVLSRGPISWADDHAPISDSLRDSVTVLITNDLHLQVTRLRTELHHEHRRTRNLRLDLLEVRAKLIFIRTHTDTLTSTTFGGLQHDRKTNTSRRLDALVDGSDHRLVENFIRNGTLLGQVGFETVTRPRDGRNLRSLRQNVRRNLITQHTHHRRSRADELHTNRLERGRELRVLGRVTPTRPHSVHTFTLRDFCNERHVRVVVLVGTTRNFNVIVREADEFGIRGDVFRRRHGQELNGVVVAKRVESPSTHREDALRRSHTVVRDENLTDHTLTATLGDVLRERIGARRRRRARRSVGDGVRLLLVASLRRARNRNASRRVRATHSGSRRSALADIA